MKKSSLLGWWMVVMTVRPVLATLRTTRMTMRALRASRPDVGSSDGGWGQGGDEVRQLLPCTLSPPPLPSLPPHSPRKRMGQLDTSSTPIVRILRCPGARPSAAPGSPILRSRMGVSSSRSMISDGRGEDDRRWEGTLTFKAWEGRGGKGGLRRTCDERPALLCRDGRVEAERRGELERLLRWEGGG